MQQPKKHILRQLRAQLRSLEKHGGSADASGKSPGDAGVVSFGLEAVDRILPDRGLPSACLHEIVGTGDSAETGFCAVIAHRFSTGGLSTRRSSSRQDAPVLWLQQGQALYAPGLTPYGLDPRRLIVVSRLGSDQNVLWAMEEALRAKAAGAVVGELKAIDLASSRRLQLAAQAGGTTGLLLRQAPPKSLGQADSKNSANKNSGIKNYVSAATTRWRVTAIPSTKTEPGPGVGPNSGYWRVELLRCRQGRPGAWNLHWDGGQTKGQDGGWSLTEEAPTSAQELASIQNMGSIQELAG